MGILPLSCVIIHESNSYESKKTHYWLYVSKAMLECHYLIKPFYLQYTEKFASILVMKKFVSVLQYQQIKDDFVI